MHLSVVALALAAVLGNPSAQAAALAQPMPQAQTVEEYVRAYFADEPVLAEIASCESHFKQFDKDGQVLKNANSSAVGVFQIMSSIHTGTDGTPGPAAKLGLDINTIQGNVAYARYLYDTQGTAPWNASKACWGKTKAAQALAINK